MNAEKKIGLLERKKRVFSGAHLLSPNIFGVIAKRVTEAFCQRRPLLISRVRAKTINCSSADAQNTKDTA